MIMIRVNALSSSRRVSAENNIHDFILWCTLYSRRLAAAVCNNNIIFIYMPTLSTIIIIIGRVIRLRSKDFAQFYNNNF